MNFQILFVDFVEPLIRLEGEHRYFLYKVRTYKNLLKHSTTMSDT